MLFSLAWRGMLAPSEPLENFWPDLIIFEELVVNSFDQPASML
jgi:hypothetical protein